jgi:hypothetical protein
MSQILEGGCLCGAVRFKGEAEAPSAMHCCCKDCQRATGSAFATIVAVPAASFEVSGPTKSYRTAGESGRHVERWFCSECGSQLYSQAEVMADSYFIKAGVLDDSSVLEPQMVIWASSRPAWAELAAELPCTEGNPGG